MKADEIAARNSLKLSLVIALLMIQFGAKLAKRLMQGLSMAMNLFAILSGARRRAMMLKRQQMMAENAKRIRQKKLDMKLKMERKTLSIVDLARPVPEHALKPKPAPQPKKEPEMRPELQVIYDKLTNGPKPNLQPICRVVPVPVPETDMRPKPKPHPRPVARMY